MRTLKILFLTGLGAGFSPVAPGTAGSIVGLLFYLIFLSRLPHTLNILLFIFVFAVAIYFSNQSFEIFGEEDSSKIVIDEILGIWASLMFIKLSFYSVVDAFLIFRFLDIYKPYPVRLMDDLKNGLGIVMDDVVAGLITNIILRIIF